MIVIMQYNPKILITSRKKSCFVMCRIFKLLIYVAGGKDVAGIVFSSRV